MSFSAGLALAISAVLSQPSAAALAQQMPQAQSVQEYVANYFADEPIMIAIAGCESQFRQYDKDGSVLKNPGSSAVGLFQIMSSIHDPIADKLGIDIYTLQGNAAYARYVYEQKGTKPWNASKACWSKAQAYKDMQATKTLAVK